MLHLHETLFRSRKKTNGHLKQSDTGSGIHVTVFIPGVAYITDKRRGNCSYRTIEGGDFDDRSSGPNTVRIRNSKEFFYFDVKTGMASYEGVVRYII